VPPRPATTREAGPEAIHPAESRIVAVTVYQSTAMVTRAVRVPAGQGMVELAVGPLPASTIASSLYSEGAEGLRVLTTRYRTRAVKENVQEDLRALQAKLKQITDEQQATQSQIMAADQNLQLLAKLENFTAATATAGADKGLLNADAITKVSQYIMDTRQAKSAEAVQLKQKLQEIGEMADYVRRQIGELSGTGDKTVREAVVVIDKAAAPEGWVRLSYLVSAASWRPEYKLRAEAAPPGGAPAQGAPAGDKGAVQLEYLAAISQQSGEDWTNVDVVLSTAQPALNAAPPDLAMLEVSTLSITGDRNNGAISVNGTANMKLDMQQALQQRLTLSQKAQDLANAGRQKEASLSYNQAAAVGQASELTAERAATTQPAAGPAERAAREGQSVTFHLGRKLSVPWRDEEQLIEVARISLKSDYFYKALPVLTPHVYRLAKLTNDSQYVILPGEATMYLGSDFVGRATLPLVATGEQFTAGFGVDPQLQVQRELVDKTQTVQGGNQVHRYTYRIAIDSYKSEPVKMQVWDRLPHSEGDQVNIMLEKSTPELSDEARYVREERPKNLLRWDLTIPPGANGEKAQRIEYIFKMEFAKDAAIRGFATK
jgi:hypothetical protein